MAPFQKPNTTQTQLDCGLVGLDRDQKIDLSDDKDVSAATPSAYPPSAQCGSFSPVLVLSKLVCAASGHAWHTCVAYSRGILASRACSALSCAAAQWQRYKTQLSSARSLYEGEHASDNEAKAQSMQGVRGKDICEHQRRGTRRSRKDCGRKGI